MMIRPAGKNPSINQNGVSVLEDRAIRFNENGTFYIASSFLMITSLFGGRLSPFAGIRSFKEKHREAYRFIQGYIFCSFIALASADLFNPLYYGAKKYLAFVLDFWGIRWASFAGDNAESPYTNLQRAQDFYRESRQREAETLKRLQNLEIQLKQLERRKPCQSQPSDH